MCQSVQHYPDVPGCVTTDSRPNQGVISWLCNRPCLLACVVNCRRFNQTKANYTLIGATIKYKTAPRTQMISVSTSKQLQHLWDVVRGSGVVLCWSYTL